MNTQSREKNRLEQDEKENPNYKNNLTDVRSKLAELKSSVDRNDVPAIKAAITALEASINQSA